MGVKDVLILPPFFFPPSPADPCLDLLNPLFESCRDLRLAFAHRLHDLRFAGCDCLCDLRVG